MESFHCEQITLKWNGEIIRLEFETAVLFVVTEEDDFKSWFVDMTAIANQGVIDKLLSNSDIRVKMNALTIDGLLLDGDGHIHPNLSGSNATIRGDGELIGYPLNTTNITE